MHLLKGIHFLCLLHVYKKHTLRVTTCNMFAGHNDVPLGPYVNCSPDVVSACFSRLMSDRVLDRVQGDWTSFFVRAATRHFFAGNNQFVPSPHN